MEEQKNINLSVDLSTIRSKYNSAIQKGKKNASLGDDVERILEDLIKKYGTEVLDEDPETSV